MDFIKEVSDQKNQIGVKEFIYHIRPQGVWGFGVWGFGVWGLGFGVGFGSFG